ncbi:fumarylacetoacetate hydrolase family protein [Fusobacterium sp. MFO224]|uniref:fumarylacetoacetate hydrolase family protein n=1 Tax=Fusobacterium sp. MFO224 TaxID=3378070 RepID=UPI003852FE1C
MKFLKFIPKNSQKESLGILSKCEKFVIELKSIDPNFNFKSTLQLIENITENNLILLNKISSLNNLEKYDIFSIKNITVLSPFKKTKHDIICAGFNYMDHLKEIKKNVTDNKKNTIYFSKRATYILGPNEEITPHFDINNSLDYEVELAVIIGKKGYQIKENEVEDYIFGYTILNDISSRNLQGKYRQWYIGKSLDSFTSLGPFIIHKSSLPMPFDIDISSYLNGELRQNSNTKNMITPIDKMIVELSKGITLEPGDIIATGTCSGVGIGFNPPKYMQSGDKIECIIEKIGNLINFVK